MNTEEFRGIYLIIPPSISITTLRTLAPELFPWVKVCEIQATPDPILHAEWRAYCREASAHNIATILKVSQDVSAYTQNEVLPLIEGAVTQAASCQLIKSFLKDGQVLGAYVGTSRDAAMLAGQNGVDYVVLGGENDPFPTEYATWWHTYTHLPSVALCSITLTEGVAIDPSIVDFIGVSRVIWEHPQGPAVALQRLHQSLGLT